MKETIHFLNKQTSLKPQIALVLGSGWAGVTDSLKIEKILAYKDIPSFCVSTVEGHSGEMILGTFKEKPIVVLKGRLHLYEGYTPEQVVHPLRCLIQWGVPKVLLTNASGGLNPQMKPGDLMIVEDHINLTGHTPLKGKNREDWGPRFPEMTKAYDSHLNQILEESLKENKASYSKGIYGGVLGPSYETPAEIRYLQKIGVQAVGMSTVLETIACHHMGAAVCALSCITNLGAGLSSEALTHEDVQKTAQKKEALFQRVLETFLSKV